LLAEQLEVLFDGALANSTKRGETTPAEAALVAAEALLNAATARHAAPRRKARRAHAA
jgi:hypothetical protein